MLLPKTSWALVVTLVLGVWRLFTLPMALAFCGTFYVEVSFLMDAIWGFSSGGNDWGVGGRPITSVHNDLDFDI